MGWIVYLTGLGICLLTAWRWFPRSRMWLLALATVAILLAAPWRAIPSEPESALAPASIIALFSLAFEPARALEAVRVATVWAAAFALGCGLFYGVGFLLRYRRSKRQRAGKSP